jgi:hypothetical protein
LLEPLTEKTVAACGRYSGFYVNEMQKLFSKVDTANMEHADCLTDPTGIKQRGVILGILYQQDVRLLEEASLAIEQTNDGELLKLFANLAPFLFTGQFRMHASALFGEGFEKVRPMLWHILNKPIWWQTFREHRNDGLSEGAHGK